jgi:maltose alpha-D-glucosyltransferase/alpha-amylase
MAFHFPLMPRIYMALRQEDRLPITDIMAQTPPIPDNCQWGLFLRNHDELTLEMVTDDERDYMYFAYSADPRMRINVGIRRRLAPLVDNNRRRIELLNSLLLSFPGTPILYYGDEIGMGDNIYLGDRNGVRTPMQWTSDRNAGFSKCDPARLYLPVVMDPIYGYPVVNVEAQLSDQSSLLHWTRNMIALRKLFQVFGRGTLTFLNPSNRKILAYLRELELSDGFRETVLCVANLSRFAQPVTLDLANYAGYEPVEMLGYVRFPTITREPYSLTLAPYSFIWLEWQAATSVEEMPPDVDVQTREPVRVDEASIQPVFANGWTEFIAGGGSAILEPALIDWLPRKRWFGSKTHKIESVRVRNWVELVSSAEAPDRTTNRASQPATIPSALFFFDVTYFDGSLDVYQVPLAVSTGAALDEIVAHQPESIIAKLTTAAGPAILHDATVSDEFQHELLSLIARDATLPILEAGMQTEAIEETANQPVSVGDESQAVAVGAAVTPAPLSAQPGDTATPPRTDIPTPQSSETSRFQPRESPSAGNSFHDGSRLDARASNAFPPVLAAQRLPSHVGSAEQSNTSIIYGKQLFLKIYRRLQPEENPDVEVGRFLTEVAHFNRIPPFLGEISISSRSAAKTTVALLQGMVPNQGDGWQWFLDELSGWLPTAKQLSTPPHFIAPSWQSAREKIPEALEPARSTLDAAALLGARTAELHLALSSSSTVAAFIPEPLTGDDLAHDIERIESQIKTAFEALKFAFPKLDDATSDQAGLLLSRRAELIQRARSIQAVVSAGQRIRIHGDYHLGQTLRVAAAGSSSVADKNRKEEFVLIDFEGEPARPIEERRRKQSPLKDVVGMMRSFAYAAFSAVDRFIAGGDRDRATDRAALVAWAQAWQAAATSQFLSSYREGMAARPELLPPAAEAQILLDAYLLEKALYELLYELDNRPSWVWIPLNSILAL